MPLKMGQVDHEIIVFQMIPYNVVLEVLPVFYRNMEFSFGIHDVHPGNVKESVVFGGLHVGLRAGAFAAIGRVALHDGAVHLAHQVPDEGGLEEIVPSGFSRADFDGHPSGSRTSQGLVNLHEAFRGYLFGHQNF